ncbi:MAG: fimbrial assembly protein, partial [Nitrococcus sp.]|nr:fimbrial assembly protein [Nitrococcus sp.]
SGSGNAVLYLVNIADGSLIKKIDTGMGTADDPTTTTDADKRPNGLATVTPADVDGDSIVDYFYAGDLFGNLWKFDVTDDNNTNNWVVAHNAPLFTGVRSSVHQPITTAPSIRRHPTGEGLLVLFGTGKYLESSDANASTAVQSVYGIWDRDDGKAFTRNHLLAQTIQQETDVDGTDYRIISDNPLTWYTGATGTLPSTSSDGYLGWYMDLTTAEMQVTDTLVRGNRLIFTTLIPNDDPCSLGGDSWLMVLDYRDGGRLEPSVFDTNSDGVYDLDDLVDADDDANTEPVGVSGQKSNNGILQTPSLGSMADADRAYLGGSDGKGTDCAGQDCTDLGRDPSTRNRQSWRQLR